MRPERYDEARQHWKARALIATRGNQTKLGMILIAILGKAAANPPRIVAPNAIIDEKGMVIALFQDRGWQDGELVALCHIRDLVDAFRRLADGLRLEDAERVELFDEFKKWISKDLRAEPSILV